MEINLQKRKTLTNQINAALLMFAGFSALVQLVVFQYPNRALVLSGIMIIYAFNLLLNNMAFTQPARIITCLAPPLHLLIGSLLVKLNTLGQVLIIDFFLPRFFMLSFIILPFILIDAGKERRTFWFVIIINFVSLLIFDPLHSWFNVGIEQFYQTSINYYLISFYVVINWLVILAGFGLLIANNRQVAFKLLRRNIELQEKHSEVKDLMQELTLKNKDLEEKANLIEEKNAALQQQNETILVKQEQMRRLNVKLSSNELVLRKAYQKLKEREIEAKKNNSDLIKQHEVLHAQKIAIEQQAQELLEANRKIKEISQNQERTIQQKTQELANAYEELDTFLYRASHDFRRPLTTLMGLSELAQIVTKDSAALDLFTKVKVTAIGLDKMLEKLRMVSEISVPNHKISQINLQAIIQSIQQEFAFLMNERGIDFQTDIEVIKGLYTAEHLLYIILKNLIENAIIFYKANAHPPSIQVSAWQAQEMIYIQVKDNGQGIDQAYSERIFDMYFRASENSQGNGLGLYVVRKALEQLKAQIEIDSTINKGSTFLLKINKKSVLQ